MASDLPHLLAGPILRRAAAERVVLWVATKFEPVAVQARIFLAKSVGTHTALSVKCTFTTARLGKNLSVTLIEVTPANNKEFPTGVLLAYDLSFSDEAGDERLLDTLLLDGLQSISYGKFGLPTFFIPVDHRVPLHFLQGSCRKPHGGGFDSLAAGDLLIENTVESLTKIKVATPTDLLGRPAMLLLTGDQIYADDVHDSLLPLIIDLSKQLMGFDELIPSHKPEPWPNTKSEAARRAVYYHEGGKRKRYRHLPPAEVFRPRVLENPGDFRPTFERASQFLPGYQRKQFVHRHAGFSTQDDNHLLSFGEFAAMYLLVWNPDLWPRNGRFHLAVDRMRRTLWRVRRLLANTAVYMIFDDHEITDDWNIDKHWIDNTTALQPGRRILANGLAAYWAFQGWGNDPSAFDTSFRQTITNYLDEMRRNKGGISRATSDGFQQTMLTFDNWAFTTPVQPSIMFLDTRTQRDARVPRLSDYQNHIAAKLMNLSALRKMHSKMIAAGFKPERDPLFLVSATPVFGYEPAEDLQEEWLVPGSWILEKLGLEDKGGRYTWDLESWRANRDGFVNFVSFLSERLQPRYCLFLSGDVHYAYSSTVAVSLLKPVWGTGTSVPVGEQKMPVVQLTSSSLKNSTSDTRDMIGKWLPRYMKYSPTVSLNSLLPKVWKHPKDHKKKVLATHQKLAPIRGTGVTNITGETNLGYVTVHSFERANIAVTHTLLLYNPNRYKDSNGLRNNSTTLSTIQKGII